MPYSRRLRFLVEDNQTASKQYRRIALLCLTQAYNQISKAEFPSDCIGSKDSNCHLWHEQLRIFELLQYRAKSSETILENEELKLTILVSIQKIKESFWNLSKRSILNYAKIATSTSAIAPSLIIQTTTRISDRIWVSTQRH